MHRKHLFVIAALIVVLLSPLNLAFSQDFALPQNKPGGLSAQSAQGDGAQAQSDQDMELLRKDLRSARKQMVAANMSLTDAEAEKFWPVYDQYAADLSKVDETKATLIKHYMQTFDMMSSDEAENYLQKRAAAEESVIQLRLKYIPLFRKVLSGRQTARFFQIDWRLGLMMDLQLAQMPLIDP